MRCRTVDSGVEKLEIAGDNRPQPVGCRWTTSSPACGSRFCPQPVEIFCPRIHKHLTWSDRPSPAAPVDTIWTTSQSPGCGRKKVTKSVEGSRNPAGIRTAGGGRAGGRGQRTSSGAAVEGLRIGSEGLRSASRRATEGLGSALERAWTSLGLLQSDSGSLRSTSGETGERCSLGTERRRTGWESVASHHVAQSPGSRRSGGPVIGRPG